MKSLLLITSITLAGLLGVAQAADIAAGKEKSATCAGCHGVDGNSPSPAFPKLAGQHADYVAKQLKDFQSGARQDPTMVAMVAALTDDDINNLAAFYAGQEVKVGEAAADAIKIGERIYRAGNADRGVPACLACHGPSGSGISQSGFPALGGQYADYVSKALNGFRDGTRTNDASKMMRQIAANMSDAEIAAVSQYIQGLH